MFVVFFKIVILVTIGYLAKAYDYLKEESFVHLRKYVIQIGLPGLFFHSVYSLHVDEFFSNLQLLNIYVLSVLSAGVMAYMLYGMVGCEGQERRVMSVNAVIPNVMGVLLPVMFYIQGGDIFMPFICMAGFINIFLVLCLGGFLFEGLHHLSMTRQIFLAAKECVRSPLFYAALAGLLASCVASELMTATDQVADILATSLVPVALICVGASLHMPDKNKSLQHVAYFYFIKICMLPLCLFLWSWLYGIDWSRYSLLLLAVLMPPSTFLAIMIQDRSCFSSHVAMTFYFGVALTFIVLYVYVLNHWLLF